MPKTVRFWLDRSSQNFETLQEVVDMLSIVRRGSKESKQPLSDLQTPRQFAREGRNGFEWCGPQDKVPIIVKLLESIPGVKAKVI